MKLFLLGMVSGIILETGTVIFLGLIAALTGEALEDDPHIGKQIYGHTQYDEDCTYRKGNLNEN